jgi:hypothetical protein
MDKDYVNKDLMTKIAFCKEMLRLSYFYACRWIQGLENVHVFEGHAFT